MPSAKFKPPNNMWTESVEMPNPYFDILNHKTNPQSIWKVINTTSFLLCVHIMLKIVSCEFNPGINVSRLSPSTVAHRSRHRAQFFRLADNSSTSRAYRILSRTISRLHFEMSCLSVELIFFTAINMKHGLISSLERILFWPQVQPAGKHWLITCQSFHLC